MAKISRKIILKHKNIISLGKFIPKRLCLPLVAKISRENTNISRENTKFSRRKKNSLNISLYNCIISFTFKSVERTVAKRERNIIISKQELCGGSQKTTRMLENVVKYNALNKTGHINYNKGGIKDGVGFQPCSDKFVDNFILRILAADYLIQKNRYVEVGSINRTIRAMLNRSGLEKCKVKVTLLSCANVIPAEMLRKMPFRNEDEECGMTKYYFQDYKIACANVEYESVLQFLRTKEYCKRGLFLKDIDITMDYAGSFDRESN